MGHDAKSRVDTLNAFKASKGPMVLVSPSMTEGVDLAEDLCRFTITAKLPFPNKGDERVARRMKVVKDDVSGAWVTNARGNDWYMWVTACTLVQSVGRGMRSAEDQQVCYIIDRAASWFLPAVWRMLPDWFKEAVKKQSPEAVMMDLNRAGIRADLLAG